MNRNEYVKKKLKRSAEESEELWRTVRSRVSDEFMNRDENVSLLDILQNSDGTVSLVMVRSDEHTDLNQVELWHFSASNKFLKKAKIELSISSGPFLEEFLESTGNVKDT
ncbi:hypothetical protein [Parahaliea mediterranea]|uniref:Uncharacterized protein n=1 Tax=Parahaliea mediterranea TaxID=651086 RepID=A0A939DJ23_9GAMM|nr:hypothetical protein [Parahaliea mediterranea]MBN7799178.1 hypothetical protein [Parahaliea mediterranea]